MNAADWNLLADRSRAVVHHASLLMGMLTHPTHACDDRALAPPAGATADALDALLAAMTRAPELAAHVRTLQRFDVALAAWRRSVSDASPLAARYQTAMLQQCAHGVTSALHVEALAASESGRLHVTRSDLTSRA